MKVNGKPYRTIWEHPSQQQIVQIIDQRSLPFEFIIEDLNSVTDVITAISEMHVRGAGLIGATAAYGMYLAALASASSRHGYEDLLVAGDLLKQARPTAVNLSWAVERQLSKLLPDMSGKVRVASTLATAREITDGDASACYDIGQHGIPIIRQLAERKPDETINILTHCNAGWLAFVDHGSATAPIYAAHDAGIPVHVWVDETRPRNQGARLTAWELEQHGVPFSVVPDNVGGHLMQHGLVDLVIVGTDRTTFTGDVANKIGTYLKALAAHDNNIPFYVALPSSSFDWIIEDGVNDIPIEERGAEEVKTIQGLLDGKVVSVRLTTETAPARNYAFDVTPSRLVTGLITERGICQANASSVFQLFPEKRKHHVR
jgi:methylthioribose-1-phosphate isomerase